LGEHPARQSAITAPRYLYEVDEYNRIMAEKEERQRKQDLEVGD
jgi:hypothetical protein